MRLNGEAAAAADKDNNNDDNKRQAEEGVVGVTYHFPRPEKSQPSSPEETNNNKKKKHHYRHALGSLEVFKTLEEAKLCLIGMNKKVPDEQFAMALLGGVHDDCGDEDYRPTYYRLNPIKAASSVPLVDDEIATLVLGGPVDDVFGKLFWRLARLIGVCESDAERMGQHFKQFHRTLFVTTTKLASDWRGEFDTVDTMGCAQFIDKINKWWCNRTGHGTTIFDLQQRPESCLDLEEVCDLLTIWIGLIRAGKILAERRMSMPPCATQEFQSSALLPLQSILDTLTPIARKVQNKLNRSLQSASLSVIAMGDVDQIKFESSKGNRVAWSMFLSDPVRFPYADERKGQCAESMLASMCHDDIVPLRSLPRKIWTEAAACTGNNDNNKLKFGHLSLPLLLEAGVPVMFTDRQGSAPETALFIVFQEEVKQMIANQKFITGHTMNFWIRLTRSMLESDRIYNPVVIETTIRNMRSRCMIGEGVSTFMSILQERGKNADPVARMLVTDAVEKALMR